MKIERVKLRGFTGIRKGLSLDEVSLDLSGLSGLIALAGPNGKGKSTLLESMTPWRSLASRSGALQHHVFLRDSLKEIFWTWNGDTYRSLIKIDAQSGKSEAFLYRGEVPIASGNKGYDNTLREMLGTEALFFSSVFCAQNSEKLSDMRPGDLKSLFAEFLRLHLYIQYEEEAKKRRNDNQALADALENERKYLEGEVSRKADLLKQLPEKQARLDRFAGELEFKKTSIDKTNTSLFFLRKRVEDNRIHEARLKDLQAQGKKLADDWQKEKTAAEKGIAELKAKAQEVEGGIAANNLILEKKEEIRKAVIQEKDLSTQLQDAQKKKAVCDSEIRTSSESLKSLGIQAVPIVNEIALKEKIIARKDEIEAAVLKEKELSDTLKIIEEEYSKVTAAQKAVLAALGTNGRIQVDLGGEIRALKQDPQTVSLETAITAAKRRKALWDKRDPACTSTICSFIVDALKAEDEIPALEKALKDRKDLITLQLEGKQKDLQKIEDALTLDRKKEATLDLQWRKLTTQKEGLNAELLKVKPIAALKSSLDESLLKIDELRERLHNIESQQAETARKLDTLSAEAARLSALIEKLEADLKPVLELSGLKPSLDTATAKLEELEKRKFGLEGDILSGENNLLMRKLEFEDLFKKNVAAIQSAQQQVDPLAAADLEQEEQSLKDLTASKETCEKEIASLRADLSALEAQIRDLEGKEKRLQEIQEKRAVILKEAGQWGYLKDACGAKGLRALEIDSVAPTISAYANDLLSRTFGPLFQVRFRTQNDEGKEVLDILTIREDGTETLIENLSGGERVWILKALRLAMLMISREKSGKAYGSLFCDEEDGPLSSDNAVHFISLYRSLMSMAGMETCFYISHRPEAIAMADYTLEFNGKGVEIF